MPGGGDGIVPIYNVYQIFKRSRPPQAVLFTILSFVCGIFGIVSMWDLVKMFGKSAGFFVGVLFLPFIFLPILAFGNARYQGPAAS